MILIHDQEKLKSFGTLNNNVLYQNSTKGGWISPRLWDIVLNPKWCVLYRLGCFQTEKGMDNFETACTASPVKIFLLSLWAAVGSGHPVGNFKYFCLLSVAKLTVSLIGKCYLQLSQQLVQTKYCSTGDKSRQFILLNYKEFFWHVKSIRGTITTLRLNVTALK